MTEQTEHVILVALSVTTDGDREAAERYLHDALPLWRGDDGTFQSPTYVDSWWIAEDDRRDGSDCDSAVFCTPGKQVESVEILRALDLAPDNGQPNAMRDAMDTIIAAARSLLHGEDWDRDRLARLADALTVDHADVEALA